MIVHLSSSEIISCKECGQRFDTIEALREHEKSEQQDKELQNKGLWCYRWDGPSRRGKAQNKVNLIPTCVKCGSPVTDSLEAEVEEQGQLKRGKYVNSVWMCNECANAQRTEGKNGSNDEHEIKVGVAIPADVSPNTPKADEADL